MPIVIDEFEVVANDEESSQGTGSPVVTNIAAPVPALHDLEIAVERQCERYERVRAH
jgi:hypothetical protein